MRSNRIQVICNHREIINYKPRSENDSRYATIGDEVFPISDEICGKPKQVLEEFDIGNGQILQKLACGHWDVVEKASIVHNDRNKLWNSLFPFQKEFVSFAESCGLRVILRDEMGLGKTVETLSLLRENADRFTANFTKFCLIVTPSGGPFQWEEECQAWLGLDNPIDMNHVMLTPQVIVGTKQKLSFLSKVVICPWSKLTPFIVKQLTKQGLASIIVDEAHFYKDENSKRTQVIIDLVKSLPQNAPIVFLSGTLTENRVLEMKVALNAVDPTYFHSWRVIDRFCLHAGNKTLGLNPILRDEFFKRTSRYMIGRTKSQVGIPLPELERESKWISVEDFSANREFASEYNDTLDVLQEELANAEAPNIIALMQKLRHLTGKMKILSLALEAHKFLTENPDEKLAIGIHHQIVRESLVKLLAEFKPLQMSDEDAKEKDEIEKQFRNGHRLLICSILGAGVGRNLQFCRNAIVGERQWNRAKEDQFEQRFWRIMKDAHGNVRTVFTDHDTVHIKYINLKNSFDEYFDELVKLKGAIQDSTDENCENPPEADFMLELARKVVQNRMRFTS